MSSSLANLCSPFPIHLLDDLNSTSLDFSLHPIHCPCVTDLMGCMDCTDLMGCKGCKGCMGCMGCKGCMGMLLVA
jgi:hypothetical protein